MKKLLKKLSFVFKDTAKRNKLLVLFVILFGIVLSTGCIYYGITRRTSSVTVRFLMSFQNALECALANPILTVSEISSKNQDVVFLDTSSLLNWRYILVLVYGAAVIAFPIVNLFLAFSILDEFLHLLPELPWEKRTRVLVVGYNEQVRGVLARRVSDKKIYLWADHTLSRDEEWKLHFDGVSVKNENSLIVDGGEEEQKIINKLNEFIQEKRISNILLLDELSAVNMQHYLSIFQCQVCKERNIHFFMLCKDWEIRKFAEDVFDERLNKEMRPYDLRIFSYEQLVAEKLFRNVPIFSGSFVTDAKSSDVHMLIIGGGSLGEAVLLQTMNLGVLSDCNEILIDVIDRDITNMEKRLNKRFQTDFFEIIKTEKTIQYVINPDKADGILRIRLYQSDIEDEPLEQLTQELSENFPVTYAVVCIPGQDLNLHCLIALEKLKRYLYRDFPVALRMMYTKALEEYIVPDSETLQFHKIWFMGDKDGLCNVNDIIDADEELKIREYNFVYNEVTGTMKPADIKKTISAEQADKEWNQLMYYKREVNRALYYHSVVKEKMEDIKGICVIPDEFWENGTAEGNNAAYSERLLEKDEYGNCRYPQLIQWAKTEHRRWCYFMASYGWNQTGANKKKDSILRLHNCMRPWDELIDPENPQARATVIYDLLTYITRLKK